MLGIKPETFSMLSVCSTPEMKSVLRWRASRHPFSDGIQQDSETIPLQPNQRPLAPQSTCGLLHTLLFQTPAKVSTAMQGSIFIAPYENTQNLSIYPQSSPDTKRDNAVICPRKETELGSQLPKIPFQNCKSSTKLPHSQLAHVVLFRSQPPPLQLLVWVSRVLVSSCFRKEEVAL